MSARRDFDLIDTWIILLVCQGATYRSIGVDIGMSRKTVDHRIGIICKKWNIQRKIPIVVREAARRGIVKITKDGEAMLGRYSFNACVQLDKSDTQHYAR